MNWFYHALEALRAFASKKHHGEGCSLYVCEPGDLCAACRARVALEKLADEVSIELAEKLMTRTLVPPNAGRWRILSKVSPSGKTLFVCLSCGNVSPGTSPDCSQPVKLWNGEERRCRDWKPSSFEVQ